MSAFAQSVFAGAGARRRGEVHMAQRRQEVEYRGRRRSCLRSAAVAAVLLAVQQPMRGAVQDWSPGDGLDDVVAACTVPLRLSLALDLGLAATLVLLGLRLRQLGEVETAGEGAGRRWLRPAWLLVTAAALLDVVENALLWSRAQPGPGALRCPSLVVDEVLGLSVPLTPTLRLLYGAGMGVLVLVVARQLLRRTRRPVAGDLLQDAADERTDAPQPEGLIICCSGGGIRSASFCLGGLQTLRERGLYARARAVVGVSGGGYIAAAFHALRVPDAVLPPDESPAGLETPDIGASTRHVPDERKMPVPVFDRRSPELARLRRQTRYLASNPAVITLGLLSLLFGLVVNLVLLAVLLRLTAWVLGWFLADGQVLRGFDGQESSVHFEGDWAWVDQLWWLPAAGALLFVLEKLVFTRLVAVGHVVHTGARQLGVALIWAGLALTGLVVGVPHLLSALHDLAASGSSSTPAQVASALGLGDRVQQSAEDGATGSGPLAGLLTALGAVLAAAQAAKSGSGTPGAAAGGVRGRLAALWPRVRDVVLPWAATGAVVIVGLVVFLRWTRELALDPGARSEWWVLAGCVAAVALVKLLTDANTTSLHHFYRERLAKAYLVHRQHGAAVNFPYRAPLRFSRAVPAEGPALVLAAAANVSDPEWIPTDRACTPFAFASDRTGFTDETLPGAGPRPSTALYEWVADARYRDLTIPAAMAISGAAFSPLTGRKNAISRPYRIVLALANARLGVWLPNPYWVDAPRAVRRLVLVGSRDAVVAATSLAPDDRAALLRLLSDRQLAWLEHVAGASPDPGPGREVDGTADLREAIEREWVERPAGRGQWSGTAATSPGPRWTLLVRRARQATWSLLDKPGPFRLFKEAFGGSSLYDRKIYVTDGGHYDNLGLVEALRRRPRHVIVLDASADDEDSFAALGEAIATARMDLHVDVDFDPRDMRREDLPRAQVAWGHGTARYADSDAVTDILLAKAVRVAALPWDLETYADRHPEFPRTSTGNQLYGEWDFEAYRALGAELVRRMIEDDKLPATPWQRPAAGTPAPSIVPRQPSLEMWSLMVSRWRHPSQDGNGHRASHVQ